MNDSPLRIGAVSFLNSVPLIHGLEHDPKVMLLRDLPARLADLLYDGRIEVGLVPIVEYLRGIGGEIVPGVCIASRGPVRTVKLFSRVALSEADTIAVDRGSRSSVAMLRILLAERFDRHPDMHIVEPRPDELFLHHDTVLVIGDRAEQIQPPEEAEVYDLGQLWTEFTGLPFVYAAWVMAGAGGAALPAARRGPIVEILQAAHRRGQGALEELAEREGSARGIDPARVLSYWTDAIHYRLGDEELEGLNRFAELCAKHDLCSARTAVTVADA